MSTPSDSFGCRRHKTAGTIDYPSLGIVALVAADVEEMTREDGRDMLLANLSNRQKKIIDALLGAWTRSRPDVGANTGYSPSIGGFNNLLGSLRTLGIFDYPQQGYVAMVDWAQELLNGAEGKLAA